ncbi:MAG: lipid-A-disaccharide synthase, partial [Bacteroidaceae bacterium]
MKYYLIVGEASGDLHASRLMQALRERDGDAEFRFYGGDLMQQAGGTLVCHYRHLAYMGFIPVLLHARTILRGMAECKRDILSWQPDVLILVDYPGFNLKIARFVKEHSSIPVFYYIAPKIWAWKEYRIRHIRRYVDRLFSILPFEVDFFEGKHHYPIDYVGNPTVDEVSEYLRLHPADREAFVRDNGLSGKPVVALLAGSRRQEITDNLRRMVEAARPFADRYELVLAAAPGIDDAFYRSCMEGLRVAVVRNQTYRLLQHSTAALVTSGTATLETALLGVPQVVCYYMKAGWLAS